MEIKLSADEIIKQKNKRINELLNQIHIETIIPEKEKLNGDYVKIKIVRSEQFSKFYLYLCKEIRDGHVKFNISDLSGMNSVRTLYKFLNFLIERRYFIKNRSAGIITYIFTASVSEFITEDRLNKAIEKIKSQ